MTVAIRLFGMPTLGATLRCMPSIYLDDLKTEVSRLILQELFQLEERPRIRIAVLCTPTRGIADTVKLLKRNRWVSGLFGKVDNTAADNMIHITHKSCTSPTQPFQRTPDTTRVLHCLLLLERRTSFQMPVTDVLRPSTAKEL